MNNQPDIHQHLLEKKAALKKDLHQKRLLIRQDVQDMKQDLNPLRVVGNVVKNILHPQTESADGGSGIVNLGISSGVAGLIGRYLPGAPARNIGMAVAPVIYQNIVTHVVPGARKGLVNALRWVVKKTDKKDITSENGV